MGAFANNLANAIILIISITINIILISVFNHSDKEFIIFPFNALMIGFVIVFFPLFFIFVRRENVKIKKLIENSNKTEIQSLKELPLKFDIYRKITHLIVLGVIFFYFTLGGGDIMIFTQNLVVFLVGISLVGLLTAEIVRILAPKIYPLKQINQILREKELHLRLGPHISMGIGCFSIILLYGLIQPIGPVLICTSMAMSIFGDISSNLVGRMIGRRKIRKINKTYEGLVAGIIVSFFSGIIVLYLLRNFYRFNIIGSLLIPLIGAMIIGLLDYIDLEIDDNLSFNFCLSTIFYIISVSFF